MVPNNMSLCFQPPSTDYPDEMRLYTHGELIDSEHFISTQYHAGEPQRLKPSLQVGVDSWKFQIDIEQLIEDISLESYVQSIRERFSAISTEAESFLRSNFEVLTRVEEALECLETFLGSLGVSYLTRGDYWQDSEMPDFEALEIMVRVDIGDYDRVLKLWKAAIKRISETLGSEAKEKIVVMFDKE